MTSIISFLLLVLLFVPQTGASQGARYTDPEKAFSISLPARWTVEREKRELGWVTLISSDSQPPAKLVILTTPYEPPPNGPAELKAKILSEVSAPYFQGWISALKEQARVGEPGKPETLSLNGFDARQVDLGYRRGDQYDPRKGRAIFFFGRKTAFFVTLTGSRSVFPDLEKALSTWQVEP